MKQNCGILKLRCSYNILDAMRPCLVLSLTVAKTRNGYVVLLALIKSTIPAMTCVSVWKRKMSVKVVTYVRHDHLLVKCGILPHNYDVTINYKGPSAHSSTHLVLVLGSSPAPRYHY